MQHARQDRARRRCLQVDRKRDRCRIGVLRQKWRQPLFQLFARQAAAVQRIDDDVTAGHRQFHQEMAGKTDALDVEVDVLRQFHVQHGE